MHATLKRFPPAVVLGAVALGLLFSAPAASASDTFVLDNDSKVASLLGTSLWGKGNTVNAECRTGPFPGPTETGFTFNPGNTGSITLSQNPFSKCPDFINPLIDNSIESPYLTNGTWVWIADDPVVGYASLSCAVTAQYGSQLITSRVDGLTCTVTDVVNGSAGSFGSSAAPIRDGNAVALVQHVPRQAGRRGSSRGRYKLVIRDREGGVHGRKLTKIVSGKPRKIRVPVSRKLRKQVAKRGFVRVRADLKRIDGKRGRGHRTTLTLIKDRRSLPF